jgi:flagellar motor switch protein FliN
LIANQTLHTTAVNALTELLPTMAPLDAAVLGDRSALQGRAAAAVAASFVGALSAEIALVLLDAGALSGAAGGNTGLLSTEDVLRPAFEKATAVLGAGVLSESRTEDASQLFLDPETVVFELSAAGIPSGWFAIRIRQQQASATARGTDASVLGKLGRINNVEMSLTVEIGRTRMSVRDVLDLEPGRVIELDRSAGAPADVLLNGRLIARGEIVVVDQDYAVRITKILDVNEAGS